MRQCALQGPSALQRTYTHQDDAELVCVVGAVKAARSAFVAAMASEPILKGLTADAADPDNVPGGLPYQARSGENLVANITNVREWEPNPIALSAYMVV